MGRQPSDPDLAGWDPARRANLFSECVTEGIDSLPIPATPEEIATAQTLPGSRVTLDDIRQTLELLTPDQQQAIRFAWLHFLTAALRPQITRSELHKEFMPIQQLLGVDSKPRQRTASARLGIDNESKYTLAGQRISPDTARALVMEDRAAEVLEAVANDDKSRFTDELIEALARRVSARVGQTHASSEAPGGQIGQRTILFVCSLGVAALLTACLVGVWAYKIERLNNQRATPVFTHTIMPVVGKPIRFQVQSQQDTPRVWDVSASRKEVDADVVLITREEIEQGTRVILTDPETNETLSVRIDR